MSSAFSVIYAVSFAAASLPFFSVPLLGVATVLPAPAPDYTAAYSIDLMYSLTFLPPIYNKT